jgi:ATP-dependent RNA helicase SUPV3L1/SUV3
VDVNVASAEVTSAEATVEAEPSTTATGAEPTAADVQPGTDATEAAPVEMEAFYTFTWAPRPRGNEGRGPRRERNEGRSRTTQPTAEGLAETAPAPRADRPARPEGDRRKDGPPREGYKGGKPKGKGGKPGDRAERPRELQPKTYEARPPREQKIDPDNPFAVLAALKTRS